MTDFEVNTKNEVRYISKKEKNKTIKLWILIAILVILNVMTLIVSTKECITKTLEIESLKEDMQNNYISIKILEEE